MGKRTNQGYVRNASYSTCGRTREGVFATGTIKLRYCKHNYTFANSYIIASYKYLLILNKYTFLSSNCKALLASIPPSQLMAEAPTSSMTKQNLQKLSQELTCPLCLKHYVDPRVLPCCHVYCFGCLTSSLQAGTLAPIDCDTCKATVCSSGGSSNNLENLPKAVVIRHLNQMHDRLVKLEGAEVQCEMCLDIEEKAVAFCVECEDFLCSSCLSYHRKMKGKFLGHKTYTMEEMRQKSKDSPYPKGKPPLSNCSEHNEPFKYYCFDCCNVICRDCIVLEHNDHHYELVSKSVAGTRETVSVELEPLRELVTKFNESEQLITESKDAITNQGVSVAHRIHESFTAMIDLMKRREVELLRKTQSVIRKKITRLNQQEKDIHAAKTAVTTVIDFVLGHLDMVTDDELLAVQHQLYCHMKDTKDSCASLKLTPSESPNLAVNVNMKEELERVCTEKAQVYVFPHHKKSHVQMATIGQSVIHLVSNLGRGTPTAPVNAVLTSRVDGMSVTADVLEVGKGLYEIKYTPKTRGRHFLRVSIGEEEFPHSPYNVYASLPPDMLSSKPLQIITGLKQPYAAMFNQDHNLLVSESKDTKVCFLMRDSDGLVCQKFSQFADLRSSNPSGIASDKEGNVYVTSAGGHSITKFSKEGDILGFHEVQGNKLGELMHPCGLVVIGNEVFVCDRNNCRIHVFDQDLSPLRTFGCQGKEPGNLQWPYDIVCSPEGEIYVVDCNNHRIQVYGKDGTFLRSFGSKGAEPGKLKRPVGIRLTKDGHAYISEYDNHRISVFKTDGTFVTSFASYGTKDGELSYPVGLEFDDDGYLYVCDQGNNRVQVF